MRTRAPALPAVGPALHPLVAALAIAGAGAPACAVDAFGACGEPATPIHAIQGPGAASPLAGRTGVVIEGVVVGAFPGLPDGLGGFFVQEEDADADVDPRTSEGIFVFDARSDAGPAAGETVRVRGRVREYFGLTELDGVDRVTVCPARGHASATRVHLPVASASDWERVEGMRVRIAPGLTVSDAFDLRRFGELLLSADGRLWQPTQRAAPGADALALRERNVRHAILLDDGSERRDPDPPPHLAARGRGGLRLGDRVGRVEGVVDFAFGRFRVQPTKPVRFAPAGRPPHRPPAVRGALRVAGWNVENFFNGDGEGGGFPTRGAASPDELARQRARLVAVLAALDADVLALVELENDGVGPKSAARELARALALRTGAAWEPVVPGAGALGAHAIAVALLYRPDRVRPIGRAAVLDGRAHPGFDSARNRPSLAAGFHHLATGEPIAVVVSHFKSKGSSCAAAGDPDLDDGQGPCNGTRTRAAAALGEWLAGDPAGTGGAPVLILGDLNAYPREDPIAALADAGYVDLLGWLLGPDAYTYVFAGAAGRLDHAFASPELLERVGGVAVWHANADEPPGPSRASDHDPVLVGLFPGPRPGSALPLAPDRAPSRVGVVR